MKFNCLAILTSTACVLIACSNNEKKVSDRKEDIVFQTEDQYDREDLIGVWRVFRAELVQGRFQSMNNNKWIATQNYPNQEMILKFSSDSSFSINDEIVGIWDLEHDSVLIESNKVMEGFPFYANTKYKVKKASLGNNWFFSTSFYDVNGKLNHSVKYFARKLEGKGKTGSYPGPH